MEREREGESVDRGWCWVNRSYLPIKAHYFFLFGAFAGTVPFMQILGKDLGISATAVGLVYTAVPFCVFFAKTIFGCIADYSRNVRIPMILLALATGACFLGVLFIPPTVRTSEHSFDATNVTVRNATQDFFRMTPFPVIPNKTLSNSTFQGSVVIETGCKFVSDCLTADLFGNLTVTSYGPGNTSMEFNYTIVENVTYFFIDCLSSNWSTLTCSDTETLAALPGSVVEQSSFWLYVVLAVIAGAGSATTFTLSDAACYEILGQDTKSYGRQRVFATVSWGLWTLGAGYLNDLATGHSGRNSYAPGFYIMAALLAVDLIILFAMRMPKVNTSRHITRDVGLIWRSPQTILFSISVYIVGSLTALVWNFEFWYLQDLGASQTLLGVVVAVQCLVAEIPFFILSGWFVRKFGHFRCVMIALAAFAVRIGLYELLVNPWYVLPIDLLHGLTYPVFYTAMVLYAMEYSPAGTEATMLGLLGGIFEGLGVATGSLLGGLGFDHIGGQKTLFVGSMIALTSLLLLSFIKCCIPDSKKRSNVEGISSIKFPNYGSAVGESGNRWRFRENGPASEKATEDFPSTLVTAESLLCSSDAGQPSYFPSKTGQVHPSDLTEKINQSLLTKTSTPRRIYPKETFGSDQTLSSAISETDDAVSYGSTPEPDKNFFSRITTRASNLLFPKKAFDSKQTAADKKSLITSYSSFVNETSNNTANEMLDSKAVSAVKKISDETTEPGDAITTFVTLTKTKNVVRKEIIQPGETSPEATTVTATTNVTKVPTKPITTGEVSPSSGTSSGDKIVTYSVVPPTKNVLMISESIFGDIAVPRPIQKTTTTSEVSVTPTSSVRDSVTSVAPSKTQKTVTSSQVPATSLSRVSETVTSVVPPLFKNASLKSLFGKAPEPVRETSTVQRTVTSVESPTVEKTISFSKVFPAQATSAVEETIAVSKSPKHESVLTVSKPEGTSTVTKTASLIASPTVEKTVASGKSFLGTFTSASKNTASSVASPLTEKTISVGVDLRGKGTSTVEKTISSVVKPTIEQSIATSEVSPTRKTSEVTRTIRSPTLEKITIGEESPAMSSSTISKTVTTVVSPTVERTLSMGGDLLERGVATIQNTVSTVVSPPVEKSFTISEMSSTRKGSVVKETITTVTPPLCFEKNVSIVEVSPSTITETVTIIESPTVEKTISLGKASPIAGASKVTKSLTASVSPAIERTLSKEEDLVEQGVTTVEKTFTTIAPPRSFERTVSKGENVLGKFGKFFTKGKEKLEQGASTVEKTFTTVAPPRSFERTISEGENVLGRFEKLLTKGEDLLEQGASTVEKTVTTIASPTLIERTVSEGENVLGKLEKTLTLETFQTSETESADGSESLSPRAKDFTVANASTRETFLTTVETDISSAGGSLVGEISAAVASVSGPISSAAASSATASKTLTSAVSMDSGISSSSDRANLVASLAGEASSAAGTVLEVGSSAISAGLIPSMAPRGKSASSVSLESTSAEKPKKFPKYKRKFF